MTRHRVVRDPDVGAACTCGERPDISLSEHQRYRFMQAHFARAKRADTRLALRRAASAVPGVRAGHLRASVPRPRLPFAQLGPATVHDVDEPP